MNDAVKTALGVLLRHWLLLLLGAGLSHNLVPKEIVDTVNAMSGLELLGFASAAGVMLWGVYIRLRGKTKEKIARSLPAGVSDAKVKAVLKKQPLKAIVKTEPVHVP